MRRFLFVHAHPDDESLWTGVAIARHALLGDQVHVLTCTLGEEGEVVPADLAHLELPAGQPRPADQADPLADVRREELRRATAALGVTSSVVLGEPEGRVRLYRDSGMAGTPSATHPRAFAAADVATAAALVADHVRRVGADVVVTYDEHGGYGHPDHVQTRRVTQAALALLAGQGTPVRGFEVVVPRAWARQDRDWLAAHVTEQGVRVPAPDDPYPPSVVDGPVDAVEAGPDALARQVAALRCHRTQVGVHDGFYALSNDLAARLAGREAYRRIEVGA